MTVASSWFETSLSDGTLFQFLNTCQHVAQRTRTPQVASLCVPLPNLDPLTVLVGLATDRQRQCYLESPVRGQAIAAWDSVLAATFQGGDRFQQAHECIERWKTTIHRFPQAAFSALSPHFFCSFAFFDTPSEAATPFPAAAVFLPRWQVMRQAQHSHLIVNLRIDPQTALSLLSQEILQQIRQVMRSGQGPRPGAIAASAPTPVSLSETDAEAFQNSVAQALSAIRQGQLRKQVVAQAVDLQRTAPFQRTVSLQRLRTRHPDCYIFALGNGGGAYFIGASPERLLSIRQGRLVTDALAGSAPRGTTPARDRTLGQRLLQDPKEQTEHRLVVEFILERLAAVGLQPRYGQPPGLLRLSHIQHLHTPICAEVPATLSPLELVAALHPTPAVAGVPAAIACQQIQQSERCDRGLYAAPLGWVDDQGNSEFIVGIRSALLQGDRARLYAGAGIVAGSDPQRELAEIQLKLRALAEALG